MAQTSLMFPFRWSNLSTDLSDDSIHAYIEDLCSKTIEISSEPDTANGRGRQRGKASFGSGRERARRLVPVWRQTPELPQEVVVVCVSFLWCNSDEHENRLRSSAQPSASYLDGGRRA